MLATNNVPFDEYDGCTFFEIFGFEKFKTGIGMLFKFNYINVNVNCELPINA